MSDSVETAPMPTRYSTVAIVLHWLIAVMILSLVFVGWWMEDLRYQAITGEVSFDFTQSIYNWHKTFGITVLILSLARLGWRLTHPVPALPETMTAWEKLAARGTHIAFYAMMIGLPIGGWVTASATNFPTKLFNIEGFLLPNLPVPQTEAFYEFASSAHGMGGWFVLLTAALHVAGALKHHFIERDGVLARMIPGLNIPTQKS